MNNDNDIFPTFKLTVPCPGVPLWRLPQDDERRKNNGTLVPCNKAEYASVLVRFGELQIEVWLCCCEYNSQCRSDAVNEAIAEVYGPIVLRQYTGSRLFARQNYSHSYYWNICQTCGADLSGTFWKANHSQRYALQQFSKLEWPVYQGFCSWRCCARHNGIVCAVCGGDLPEPQERDLDKLTFGYVDGELCTRGGYWVEPFVDYARKYVKKRDPALLASPHVSAATFGKYCSPQCCLLALKGAIRREQEERKKRKELKCVRSQKVLLSQVRKSLRGQPNPEAWPSLQKAFQQEVTSRE